jgi:hypothetical protein
MKEIKGTYIRLRCTEDFKEKTDKAAEMETRSTSNYIEKLITDDLKRKGLID